MGDATVVVLGGAVAADPSPPLPAPTPPAEAASVLVSIDEETLFGLLWGAL